MKAYILVQTRYGGLAEVINDLHNGSNCFFIQARPVYGWYDAVVELEIPNTDRLNEIKEELKRSQPDIIRIEAVVERIDEPSIPESGQDNTGFE